MTIMYKVQQYPYCGYAQCTQQPQCITQAREAYLDHADGMLCHSIQEPLVEV